MDDQKEGALRGSKSGMALMAMRQNLIATQISSEFFFALKILNPGTGGTAEKIFHSY